MATVPVASKLCAWLVTVAIIVSGAIGCDEDDDPGPLVPVEETSFHPSAWMDRESELFHSGIVADSSFAYCRECHGIATASDSTEVSCWTCHEGWDFGCIGCHGGDEATGSAPPTGLRGETVRSTRGVGAHAAHLTGGTYSDGVVCGSCHRTYLSVWSEGHLGADSVAEVVFGSMSKGMGEWDRDAATCAQTYCHGNFEGGVQQNVPVWVDTAGIECGSCHDAGEDPVTLGWKHAFHVGAAGLGCGECHGETIGEDGRIIGPAVHVNGKVEVLVADSSSCTGCHEGGGGSCTFCHGGTDSDNGAPPKGLRGELLTSERAVGAHTAHLAGGVLSDGIECDECHMVPSSLLEAGHFGTDSIAEVQWGDLAGPDGVWNRTQGTCGQIYCHGNFGGGKVSNNPVWTGSNEAACGSCHDAGSNPTELGGRHRQHVSRYGCYRCHSATVNSSEAIVGRGVHVNGINDVVFSGGGTYVNGTCSEIGCHEDDEW